MCGRFFQDLSEEEVRAYFDASFSHDAQSAALARYNIGPGQPIWVVRSDPKQRGRSLDALHWGLVPHFATDRKVGYRAINARAETVDRAPMFRKAFEQRRCLVVARGFYEWRGEGKRKQPFAIARSDGAPMALAGVWENWLDRETGEWLRSVAIVTTEASRLLAGVHERMPVIIQPHAFARWLGEEPAEPTRVKALLVPSDDQLKLWPVSSRMNHADVEEASILAPIELA